MSIYDCLTPFALQPIERRQGPAYIDKMCHPVPDAPVVDRIQYILAHCRNKRVLNLGSASGDLHKRICEAATSVIGVDKNHPADILLDLDEAPQPSGTFDLVVAGEILEHLSNPGSCLKAIRTLGCPLLITVPNALCSNGSHWIKQGYEIVNRDHVAWYSYHTLKTLVERYNFNVVRFAWYNGQPGTAEGLIMLVN